MIFYQNIEYWWCGRSAKVDARATASLLVTVGQRNITPRCTVTTRQVIGRPYSMFWKLLTQRTQ